MAVKTLKGLAWVLGVAAMAGGAWAADNAPKALLTEASVWRTHRTWMPAVVRAEGGLARARFHSNMVNVSPPPPPEWAQPDFDDSGWSYWREPGEAQPLKVKKGPKDLWVWSTTEPDRDIKLYRPGQYGEGLSPCMGLRCLRGRFWVDAPAAVTNLAVAVEFRGGVVVYVNGREVGRAFLPKDGPIEPTTVADEYPEEVFFSEAEWRGAAGTVPLDPELLNRCNARIRRMDVAIPAAVLSKGVNVLAVEIHRAPCSPPGKDRGGAQLWSTCGPVSVALTGSGAVEGAVDRPKGFQVWTANALTRITQYGHAYFGRVDQGAGVLFERFPLSWGDPYAPIAPIRMVGARQAVCTGQVGVSCDQTIRGLKAEASELVQNGGPGRIGAAAVEVLYLTTPGQPSNDADRDTPAVSTADALGPVPPTEVAARAGGQAQFWAESAGRPGWSGTTWIDPGAAGGVWIKVRIPADAAAGDYRGALTISAQDHKPVAVPVELRVADCTLAKPTDWLAHVGAPQSPDTLAAWYNAPLWSEAHWKLVEKSLAHMGEIGGKVVYLPLRANTSWFNNDQSFVCWVANGNGGLDRDYSVFDRYVELARKHLRPNVYCLYVTDLPSFGNEPLYTVRDPTTGKTETRKGPEYAPTPEAIAFWKPLLAEATERLVARGAEREQIMLGLEWENTQMDPRNEVVKARVELFKQAAPEGMKMAQIAHTGWYNKQRFPDHLIPRGYAMSVWGDRGLGRAPPKTRVFAPTDLPLILDKHYRADSTIDLRPTSPRGALRLCVEWALGSCSGVGPLGMDFWVFPASARTRGRGGTMEGAGASNLSMSTFSTSALLAPGPDGPISTARFEMLREGLQECQARIVVERALANPEARARLGDELAKRCEDLLKKRLATHEWVQCSTGRAGGENWQWHQSSGWEERAYDLFACAGAVGKALGE